MMKCAEVRSQANLKKLIHQCFLSLLWFPPVFVICKLGNDSQKAVQVLEKMSGSEMDSITVKDICGGLMAWATRIDPTFPQY